MNDIQNDDDCDMEEWNESRSAEQRAWDEDLDETRCFTTED